MPSKKSKRAVLERLYATFHPSAPYKASLHAENVARILAHEAFKDGWELPYGGPTYKPLLENIALDCGVKTQEVLTKLSRSQERST